MARILWVDDQQNAASTFSSVLSPLNARVTWASDGTEALVLLQRQFFDLVISDLRMPPGEWGGLWLLERMRNARIHVPVVILSGEGTQTETIKALRLGAEDYVMKENVKEELLPTVNRLLERRTVEVETRVATTFPTPIALPFRRYLNATTSVSQLRRLVEFWESVLRFSCIIGISELERGTSPVKLPATLLQNPSMGTWNQARGVLARTLPQDSAFSQVNCAMVDKDVSAIIQLRNDIYHGVEPSDLAAAEILDKSGFRAQLVSFVGRLWQRWSASIVLPLNHSYDGQMFHIEACGVTGDNVVLPSLQLVLRQPMVTRHPYLVSGCNEEPIITDLFPLICLEPGQEPNAWHTLVYDGAKIDLQRVRGDEPIRYIDIWSGQRNIAPAEAICLSDLPAAITSLLEGTDNR